MNWRRGLLLAGIHLVVAGTLLAWQESEVWHLLRSERVQPSAARLELAVFQEEEQIVNFNPCDEGGFIDGEMSPQERVSGMANLPVALITGWHAPCSTPGFVGSFIEKRMHRTRTSEILILSILIFLVVVEWLLVGGFPLIRPRLWWLEPGAFITIWTLIGSILTVIPYISHLSVIPALVACFAWLWWFSLLVWTGLRSGWRLVKRSGVHAV
jgi:hypothetical protein